MPGDTIRTEVFAKYIGPDPGQWSGGMATIAAAVATTATGTTGEGATNTEATPALPRAATAPVPDEGVPAAYLNVLLFDKAMQPVLDQSRAVPITAAAKENGTNVPHGRSLVWACLGVCS